MYGLTKSASRLQLAALVLAAGLALPAQAQDAASVASQSQVEAVAQPVLSALDAMIVTRDAEGNEVFAPAERVDPGAVIEYRITHTNQSGDALTGFIVMGAIPTGTSYVGGSAAGGNPSRFEVLVPGEDWQGEPAYKTIVDGQGEKQRVQAEPSDYARVRWVLAGPLADDSAATAIYRVRVNAN